MMFLRFYARKISGFNLGLNDCVIAAALVNLGCQDLNSGLLKIGTIESHLESIISKGRYLNIGILPLVHDPTFSWIRFMPAAA